MTSIEIAPGYGFVVKRHTEYDDEVDDGETRRVVPGMWEVHLPHQCSTWDIAGEHNFEGESHADAVASMEAFVAQAQAALEALKAERELNAEVL